MHVLHSFFVYLVTIPVFFIAFIVSIPFIYMAYLHYGMASHGTAFHSTALASVLLLHYGVALHQQVTVSEGRDRWIGTASPRAFMMIRPLL